jgi:hypothetical protein
MSGLAAALLPGPGRANLADAAALSTLVRESVEAGAPRQALLLRLGGLGPRLREEHHQRLLRETLEPLLRPSRARLYALPNGDLVAVGPERGWHMESVVQRVSTLLGEGGGAQPTATLLRLPEQAALLLGALEDSLAEEPPSPAPLPPAPLPRRALARGGEPPPADAARLAQALASADLAAFLRCRPVLRVAPEDSPSPLPQWTEWRIALPELSAVLLGTASAPLPAHLRGLLDRRLLAELARPEDAVRRGPVGISLGLAAIDSAAFRRLDALVARETRARSLIGLPAAAVLADPTGFLAARQVLCGRGWRLALDVPDAAALALLPPARVGVALVRVGFSPALAATGLPPGVPPERVVLTGVDRAAALGWGLEAGITLFEGRLLTR